MALIAEVCKENQNSFIQEIHLLSFRTVNGFTTEGYIFSYSLYDKGLPVEPHKGLDRQIATLCGTNKRNSEHRPIKREKSTESMDSGVSSSLAPTPVIRTVLEK